MIPALAFLFLLNMAASFHRNEAGDRLFLHEDAYRNLVVADTIVNEGIYGARAGVPIPIFQDALWRLLIAGFHFVVPDVTTAAFMLGVCFGLLALIYALRFTVRVFPYPFYMYLTAALLVLGPGLVTTSLAGTGAVLGLFFVLMAAWLHVEDLATQGRGLPASAAALIGLAAWLRIEYLVVWLALWVITLISVPLPADKRPTLAVAFFRGLRGLFICAMLLLPIFAWNMHLLKVPWPRLPSVPMAADAWGTEPPLQALALTWGWIRVGWYEAFATLFAHALPRGFFGFVFYILGAGVLIVDLLRLRDQRPYALLLLLPWMVPFGYGLLYPFVGPEAMTMVISSLSPFGWMVAAYGVAQVPFLFQLWGRRYLPATIPEMRLYQGWWGITALILVLAAWGSGVRESRANRNALAEFDAEQTVISAAIAEQALMRDRFFTDRPGTLRWRHGVAVIDANGEWNPTLLSFVRPQGGLDPDRLESYMERMRPPPGVMVFWHPRNYALVRLLPNDEWIIAPPEDAREGLLMAIGNWPGVF